MKTTIEFSLQVAMIAYDAITDDRLLEEKLINEFPNVWIIDQEDENEHDLLLSSVLDILSHFGIYEDEFEITN